MGCGSACRKSRQAANEMKFSFRLDANFIVANGNGHKICKERKLFSFHPFGGKAADAGMHEGDASPSCIPAS